MKVTITKNEDKLEVFVSERLDTNTAPQLEAELTANLDGVKYLTLDFKDLIYISSAGLRILLVFHKTMVARGGSFLVKHPNDEVLEILDMTGFSNFLNIEE